MKITTKLANNDGNNVQSCQFISKGLASSYKQGRGVCRAPRFSFKSYSLRIA